MSQFIKKHSGFNFRTDERKRWDARRTVQMNTAATWWL